MCGSQLSRSELEKNVCKHSDGSRGICCPERSGLSSNDVNFNSKPKKMTHDKDKSPDYDDSFDLEFGVRSGFETTR